MIKFCKKCQEEKREFCPSGYYPFFKESVYQCHCGEALVDIDFPSEDLCVLRNISEDPNFIEAMIKLRQDDIIEYETRMSQFRTHVEQKEQIELLRQESSKPHCPHCHSTNISSIGTGERIGSIAMLGVFSKKISKSFKCKNCGYTW